MLVACLALVLSMGGVSYAAARIVVTILEVLSIVVGIFVAIASPANAIGEYFGAAISLIVIALLWTRRASAFFRE